MVEVVTGSKVVLVIVVIVHFTVFLIDIEKPYAEYLPLSFFVKGIERYGRMILVELH